MKMKNIGRLLMILILCMVLSACGGNKTESTSGSKDTVSESVDGNQTTSANDAPVTPTSAPPAATATAAPSAPAFDIKKAVEVNTLSNLLKNYKSVLYSQLDYISGDNIHITYFRDEDGNYCSTEDDNGFSNYQTDYFIFNRSKGKSVYAISAMDYGIVGETVYMVADSEITSQTTDIEGNIVCEATADINQEYADILAENWPATTEDKMITKMVFAAADNRLLIIDYSLRRPNGSESKIASAVMVYDKEVMYSEAVQNYFTADKGVITIHMGDDTTRTMEIPKGETFEWYCIEGYALYLDKDGKEALPQQPEPIKGDLTLYNLPISTKE